MGVSPFGVDLHSLLFVFYFVRFGFDGLLEFGDCLGSELESLLLAESLFGFVCFAVFLFLVVLFCHC